MGMASRAPLVLAAALFVLGIAGLAQTVRQTGNAATPAPIGEVVARPLAPTTSTAPTFALVEAVSDAPAPSPVAETAATQPPTLLAPAPQLAAATAAATPEPTPAPHGGAIAAGVASDGDGTTSAVAGANPLNPLRLGMIASDEASHPAEPTATPTPVTAETATPDAAPTPALPSTGTPSP